MINIHRLTEQEKQKIIELRTIDGLSCTEISRRLSLGRTAAFEFLKREGYDTSNTNHIISNLSETDISNICALYNSGLTAKEIREQFYPVFKCDNSIIKIIKQNGITPHPAVRRQIITNESYFHSIDSEEKAYLLGYLIADGYVIYPLTRKRTPCWGIEISTKDAYVLEWIVEQIGLQNKKLIVKKNGTITSLTVTSQMMVDDLATLNITPRKSYTVQYPFSKIPKSLNRHVIRGIFDGDGCISNPNCTFYGNEFIITAVRDILFEEAGLSFRHLFYNNQNHIYSISFSAKQDKIAFYNYIYSNASIWLTRKRERFESLPFVDANTVVT